VLGRKFLEIDPTAFCGRPRATWRPQETRYITELPVDRRAAIPARRRLSLGLSQGAQRAFRRALAQSGRQYRIQEWLPFGTMLRRGQLVTGDRALSTTVTKG